MSPFPHGYRGPLVHYLFIWMLYIALNLAVVCVWIAALWPILRGVYRLSRRVIKSR